MTFRAVEFERTRKGLDITALQYCERSYVWTDRNRIIRVAWITFWYRPINRSNGHTRLIDAEHAPSAIVCRDTEVIVGPQARAEILSQGESLGGETFIEI